MSLRYDVTMKLLVPIPLGAASYFLLRRMVSARALHRWAAFRGLERTGVLTYALPLGAVTGTIGLEAGMRGIVTARAILGISGLPAPAAPHLSLLTMRARELGYTLEASNNVVTILAEPRAATWLGALFCDLEELALDYVALANREE